MDRSSWNGARGVGLAAGWAGRLVRSLAAAVMLGMPWAAPAQDVVSDTATATVVTAPSAAATGPAEVQVGAYVLRLANVSQKDGTFDVDMWLWFRWQDESLKPWESFEIANGRIDERSEALVTRDGADFYTSVRVQATVFHNFDVSRFPMDDHVLGIELEDQNLDTSAMVYKADPNSALDPGVSVPGWDVRLDGSEVQDHRYDTNYGLTGAGESHYSRLELRLDLTRTDLGPLFKQFWMSALSVILGLMAMRVRATDLDARFGLGVGSIFAASANAFVVTDSLPATTSITLAEQINFLSIGTILLCVAISVWSLRLCYQGREAASERLDAWALGVIGAGFVVANAAILAVDLSQIG